MMPGHSEQHGQRHKAKQTNKTTQNVSWGA